ncbi:unnamed protein product [Bubo scandiacus]
MIYPEKVLAVVFLTQDFLQMFVLVLPCDCFPWQVYLELFSELSWLWEVGNPGSPCKELARQLHANLGQSHLRDQRQ